MIFFKDEVHEEQTNLLLKKFGVKNISSDIEYGTFAYLVGAIYKSKSIEKVIDESGTLDIEMFYEVIEPYSTSEKGILRFALQCFNNSIDDITIGEVMRPLDSQNSKVIKQAINIRY